jgi:hypothetical protein
VKSIRIVRKLRLSLPFPMKVDAAAAEVYFYIVLFHQQTNPSA